MGSAMTTEKQMLLLWENTLRNTSVPIEGDEKLKLADAIRAHTDRPSVPVEALRNIQRIDIDCDREGNLYVDEWPTGDYVRFSDLEKLIAANDRKEYDHDR